MENIDENRVRDIVREELANFTPQKKKRAPNKWQIFLKDCAKEQDKELPYTDKVKLCSILYKDNKNKGSDGLSPEQPIENAQSVTQSVQPVQYTQSVQSEQPVQYVQPPTQVTQPTYHAQQTNVMPLTEEDADRLLRSTSEKLAKMTRRQ